MFSLIFFALVAFVLIGGFLAATWHSRRKNNSTIRSKSFTGNDLPQQVRKFDEPRESQKSTPLVPAKFPQEDLLKTKRTSGDINQEPPFE